MVICFYLQTLVLIKVEEICSLIFFFQLHWIIKEHNSLHIEGYFHIHCSKCTFSLCSLSDFKRRNIITNILEANTGHVMWKTSSLWCTLRMGFTVKQETSCVQLFKLWNEKYLNNHISWIPRHTLEKCCVCLTACLEDLYHTDCCCTWSGL